VPEFSSTIASEVRQSLHTAEIRLIEAGSVAEALRLGFTRGGRV